MPLRSGKSYSKNSDSSSDIIETELLPDCDITIPSSSDSHYFNLNSPMEQINHTDNKQNVPTSSISVSPALHAFIKNPSKFTTSVPRLKLDGSNFYDWSQAIDSVLMYIFHKVAFTDNLDSFDAPVDVMGALCFFLQHTISPNLIEMIQQTLCPKEAFQILKNNFMKSSRLVQLDLISELIDIPKHNKPMTISDYFSKTFIIFNQLKRTGLHLPDKLQGLFLKVLVPPPSGMSRASWFHSISSEIERLKTKKPRDIQ
ncbi:hypothetical protein O181_011051 [Austropuccinia psidii MF-1]|uniref:Retrotransposon Copia-like N-terminal domain-containing protein n=1 Tax=Austropuccinia psidii MF-1 TaxID=1389203 RepID=A0A9Q3BV20_9BASI|nr:hypothetical protein [Austropuccinia psidii MF-1]